MDGTSTTVTAAAGGEAEGTGRRAQFSLVNEHVRAERAAARSHFPDVAMAFATYAGGPDVTPDDALLLAPLARRLDAHVTAIPWDAAVDWSAYDVVLIRSTWDYHLHVDAFVEWAARVEGAGAALWNPAAVVRWNADKRYLADLRAAGVHIVPTEWIGRGSAAGSSAPSALRDIMQRRGWQRAVVKPAVSATSYRTFTAHDDDAADDAARLDAILADSDALVQPYMAEVAADGEWSCICFATDGALRFSHAVVKRPAHGDFRVQAEYGGSAEVASPSPALRAQIDDIAATLQAIAPAPVLYARLDGVVSDGTHAPRGTFMLMEAELIEPALFFEGAPAAPERFVEALARAVAATTP